MRRLMLATTLVFASLAACAESTQTRSVAPFTTVSNNGPISVTIEVGKALSVTASGSDTVLDQLVTEISDGELRIHMKDRHYSSLKGDAKVTITMPKLTRYAMAGSGETTITHMSGDALDIDLSGAGGLTASGEVKSLHLVLGGVGSVDTRALHAENVTASVGGIGSVKVYASQRLDASVGGVGSLTYYGDPKTVNTSSGGIGSISRGK